MQAAGLAARHADSYVMDVSMTLGGQPRRVQMISGGGRVEVKITMSGTSFTLIEVDRKAYLKGSESYWIKDGGASRSLASLLAPRWYKLSARDATSLTSALGPLISPNSDRCLTEDTGSLSVAGTGTVDGTPVIFVREHGSLPGTTSGTLAVATVGRPYPLRLSAIGPTRPGGKIDVCNDGKGDSTRGTVTITDWNVAPKVVAPTNTVALPSNS